MAEPAGFGPVSHAAANGPIPLVFDRSQDPLLISRDTGPTTPPLHLVQKNVNAYLRLQDGSRGRAIRLCISPGCGACIADEIFNYCNRTFGRGLNPVLGITVSEHFRSRMKKSVPPRKGKHVTGTRDTGHLRCSIDIAIPTSALTSGIGMRVNVMMAASLKERNGEIDMWIGTTTWEGTAHTWIEAIDAGGNSAQQAITLLDNRNQRWPITIDLNEHPAFARERGAARPKTLGEIIAERTQEAKDKRLESIWGDARRANAAHGTNRGLEGLSGRTEQPQLSTTQWTGSSGYAMEGSGAPGDNRLPGTTHRNPAPLFISPFQPQFTSNRQEDSLQRLQPVGRTRDDAEQSRNPAYARGPSHSSSRTTAEQTTQASSMLSDLRLAGPVFSEPQSMGGDAEQRRGTRRLFGDRGSPEDHDPDEDSRRRGHPAKARKGSQHNTLANFHAAGERSILNSPSPGASSGGGRRESQRHDEREDERQRQGPTREARRRDRSSSHEHDHDEDRQRSRLEQSRKDKASGDQRKDSGLFYKPSRK